MGGRMKAIYEPCILYETIEMIHNYVNGISYDSIRRRLVNSFGRLNSERHNKVFTKKIEELTRISELLCSELDKGNPLLNYYFKRFDTDDGRNGCSLAKVMTPGMNIAITDFDESVAYEIDFHNQMMNSSFNILAFSDFGLSIENIDPSESVPLFNMLDRLDAPSNYKWETYRVMTEYDKHFGELIALIRPIAMKLKDELVLLKELNVDIYAYWERYFLNHSRTDFLREMFGRTLLDDTAEPPTAGEITFNIWNFGCVAVWAKGAESSQLYIGSIIDLDLAYSNKSSIDPTMICNMLKVLADKNKLEILKRCSDAPAYAQQISNAMDLNSGTVSRLLFSLYDWGFVETVNVDGKTNYSTKADMIDRVCDWIKSYICD